MPNISKDKLYNDIEEIFKDADLSKLSSKMIRLKLQERYGIDLFKRKAEIEEIAMGLIEKYTNNSNIKSPTEDIKSTVNLYNNKRKKESYDCKKSSDSDEHDSFSSEENDGKKFKNNIATENSKINETNKNNGVKKEKSQSNGNGSIKHIKSDSICDTDGSNDEINDEMIARQLQEEEEKGARRTRHGSKKEVIKKKRVPKKEKGAPRTNSYTEECPLSPELAAFLGVNTMRRSEVVKRMWDIVKERNLFFPQNKQYMICDDDMYSIFGKKKVRLFGMMKYLSKHIYNPKEFI